MKKIFENKVFYSDILIHVLQEENFDSQVIVKSINQCTFFPLVPFGGGVKHSGHVLKKFAKIEKESTLYKYDSVSYIRLNQKYMKINNENLKNTYPFFKGVKFNR